LEYAIDTGTRAIIFKPLKVMADIPPINPGAPTGGFPPKKETGKVQPKKETVRISLPPKPTAAPTIKLPTLPPGGPTGAPSLVPTPPTAGAPALSSTAAPRATSAPAAARPGAPTTTSQPRPAPVAVATVQGISGFDKILAIAACVVALAAVGTTVWMMMLLNSALGQ
jgi:hypothetical protein